MLSRLFFRKSEPFTSSIGSQKWHSSSSVSVNKFTYRSTFAYCALGGATLAISTMIMMRSNRNKIAIASAPPVNTHHKTNPCPPWNYLWDGRTARNKATRTITLIRHGQYVHSHLESGKKLTKLGQKQAKITGKKLKSLDIDYDHIICSTMIRAKQTADIITNELYDDKSMINIVHDSNLNEGCPSNVIPQREDLEQANFFKFLSKDSNRINKSFETHIHRNDTDKDEEILIIAHGNVFRYFCCKVLQIPAEAWLRFSFDNCSITRFTITGDGRISMQVMGGNGHFTKDERSYN